MKKSGRVSFVSGWLRDLAQELRGALRRLARSRAFTLIAVLSLAVGIGVNTALFTVVHATWLEPVPGVGEADRIVEVLTTRRGSDIQLWAYRDFQDVRDAETPIEALAGLKPRDGSLTTDDGTEGVRVMYVSANYFEVIGVVPSRGRPFLPSEDVRPGGHPVAVVSHAMWQNRLGGRQDIVGLTITLNRDPYAVVGVAPEAFRGHRTYTSTDLWVPITQHPFMAGPNSLERIEVRCGSRYWDGCGPTPRWTRPTRRFRRSSPGWPGSTLKVTRTVGPGPLPSGRYRPTAEPSR
ncbi:MAG: hypothetical protein AMS25_08365 [Gemmatimonas sp. SM23_52]|nr:MAG: hypothetical protein AMS25_08365 [Gemmatimonas sp. SM23_52]